MKHAQNVYDRLKAKLAKSGECLLWCGAISGNGYGLITVGRKNFSAHRVAYAMHHGSVPDDLQVRHQCHNRRCCARRHLLTGTQLDNERDKMRAGRQAKGERNARSKLSDAQVLDIRRRLAKGEKQRAIAKSLGLVQGTISHINTGRNRRDTK